MEHSDPFLRMIEEAGTIDSFTVTVVERIEDEDAVYTAIYLDTEIVKGLPARIYLWWGVPKINSAVPAILHIHGGGSQTAYLNHVKQWVKNGYAACSYDWKGPLYDHVYYSDLTGLPTADLEEDYDPLQSVMFNRVLHAKKMVSWLSIQPEVDAERIGVYGISRGGSITWLLNHWDKRLKAVVPLYGVGRHLAPGRLNRNNRNSQTTKQLKQWERKLDGVTLAKEQHAPVLMMAATNDFWGWMDAVCDAVTDISPDKCSLTFSANQNHHLDQWAGSTLTTWMNVHLKNEGSWPSAPHVDVWLDEAGDLRARSEGTKSGNSEGNGNSDGKQERPIQVRYCWSWGDMSEYFPPGRYWNVVNTSDMDDDIVIPVINPNVSGYIYVDYIFSNGVKVSSLPLRFSPSYLGMMSATDVGSTVLADFTNGLDGWHCPDYRTEPFDPEFHYVTIENPDGGYALSLVELDIPFTLVTHKLVDPKWKPPHYRSDLSAQLHSSVKGKCTIELQYKPDQAGQRIWFYETELNEGWNELQIKPEEWGNEEGVPFATWELAHKLIIRFVPLLEESKYEAALGKVWFS